MNDLQGAQRNRPEGQTISNEIYARRVMKSNSFAQRAAQARREREQQEQANGTYHKRTS